MDNRIYGKYAFSGIDWIHGEIDDIYARCYSYIRIVVATARLNFPFEADDAYAIKRFRSAYGVLERLATEDSDDGVRRAAKEKMVGLLNQIIACGLVKDLVEVDTEFVSWFIDQKHKYCDCDESTGMEL